MSVITNSRKAIRALRLELDDLEEALDLAEVTSTTKSRRTSSEDAGVRQRGGLSDPTGDTAVDPARMGVSDTLRGADRRLLEAVKIVGSLRSALQRANARWDRRGA